MSDEPQYRQVLLQQTLVPTRLLWVIQCETCGALVVDQALHSSWHLGASREIDVRSFELLGTAQGMTLENSRSER